MKYWENEIGYHAVKLTVGETNSLFDQFDPHDDNVPSYLHHARHRFIKQEPYDWLVAHCGDPDQRGCRWRIHSGGDQNAKSLFFDLKEDAMLFKLTFHEGD